MNVWFALHVGAVELVLVLVFPNFLMLHVVVSQGPGRLQSALQVVAAFASLDHNVRIIRELVFESFSLLGVVHRKSLVKVDKVKAPFFFSDYDGHRVPTISNINVRVVQNNSQATTAYALDFLVLEIFLFLVNIFKEPFIQFFVGFFESGAYEQLFFIQVLFVGLIFCDKLIDGLNDVVGAII